MSTEIISGEVCNFGFMIKDPYEVRFFGGCLILNDMWTLIGGIIFNYLPGLSEFFYTKNIRRLVFCKCGWTFQVLQEYFDGHIGSLRTYIFYFNNVLNLRSFTKSTDIKMKLSIINERACSF